MNKALRTRNEEKGKKEMNKGFISHGKCMEELLKHLLCDQCQNLQLSEYLALV